MSISKAKTKGCNEIFERLFGELEDDFIIGTDDNNESVYFTDFLMTKSGLI